MPDFRISVAWKPHSVMAANIIDGSIHVYLPTFSHWLPAGRIAANTLRSTTAVTLPSGV